MFTARPPFPTPTHQADDQLIATDPWFNFFRFKLAIIELQKRLKEIQTWRH